MARQPVGIFDAKRETELVLGSRATWDTDRSLLNTYSLVLANAVIELPDDRPSGVALGPLGFAATWDLAERLWLLRQLAEAYATSVRDKSIQPVADFIEFIGRRSEAPSSRLVAAVEPGSLPAALRMKLNARST